MISLITIIINSGAIHRSLKFDSELSYWLLDAMQNNNLSGARGDCNEKTPESIHFRGLDDSVSGTKG
jgi:hypothetical protein